MNVILLQSSHMTRAADRKLYLGARMRVLRRELGLNQTQMAEELGISPSYLNHLERNQRPVTAQMLLRLTSTYDLDLREFVAGSADADAQDLQGILADRLLRDLAIPRHEALEVAENHPGIAEAIGRLHRALGDLRRVPEGLGAHGEPEREATTPLEWLRAMLERRRNHFPALDEAAERLSHELDTGLEAFPGAIVARLRERHNVAVKVMPQSVLVDAYSRYDFHRRRLMISEALPFSGRLFALAHQLAIDALAEPLAAALQDCSPPDAETRELLRTALANYAAAAILMPYARFFEAAESSGYDLDLLQSRFGASLEQVAHRLTTLDRQGMRGVPHFLLKLDATGNVVKRFAIEQAPLPRFAGGCPRWDVQRAFHHAGIAVADRIEHVNGTRFLTSAIALPATRYRPRSLIVIGAAEKHSARLGRLQAVGRQDPTPVGVACNVCPRPDCPARTLPPTMRTLDFRPYQRPTIAFPFREI